jgi:hypothetical protein
MLSGLGCPLLGLIEPNAEFTKSDAEGAEVDRKSHVRSQACDLHRILYHRARISYEGIRAEGTRLQRDFGLSPMHSANCGWHAIEKHYNLLQK